RGLGPAGATCGASGRSPVVRLLFSTFFITIVLLFCARRWSASAGTPSAVLRRRGGVPYLLCEAWVPVCGTDRCAHPTRAGQLGCRCQPREPRGVPLIRYLDPHGINHLVCLDYFQDVRHD